MACPNQAAICRNGATTRIKYIYTIDYPVGQKRAYPEWVRSIAETLQSPAELRRLALYDNFFSASPYRVVEFEFEALADAATYFERKEISRVLQGELPVYGSNVHISVLKLLGDYTKGTATDV